MFASIARTLVLLPLALAGPALAAEGSGCQAFKWSPADAQALLRADPPRAPTSGQVVQASPGAFTLHLVPVADAGLPRPAERPAPFAAWTTVQVPAPGLYEVALSAEGWIDLVAGGSSLKAADFTGATDCPGLRKMVRFALPAGPATVQVSADQPREIAVAVRPVAP